MKHFNRLCPECFQPSDPFLGPADACSHRPGCKRIGNDERQAIYDDNTREAYSIRIRRYLRENEP